MIARPSGKTSTRAAVQSVSFASVEAHSSTAMGPVTSMSVSKGSVE